MRAADLCVKFQTLRLRLAQPRPSSPAPSSASEAGSGTGGVIGVVELLNEALICAFGPPFCV